jgi:hypothetical protein
MAKKIRNPEKQVYDSIADKTTTKKEYVESGHRKQHRWDEAKKALLFVGGVSGLLYGGTRGSSHDRR